MHDTLVDFSLSLSLSLSFPPSVYSCVLVFDYAHAQIDFSHLHTSPFPPLFTTLDLSLFSFLSSFLPSVLPSFLLSFVLLVCLSDGLLRGRKEGRKEGRKKKTYSLSISVERDLVCLDRCFNNYVRLCRLIVRLDQPLHSRQRIRNATAKSSRPEKRERRKTSRYQVDEHCLCPSRPRKKKSTTQDRTEPKQTHNQRGVVPSS
mmetsp:Transcript_31493/g.62228  ORF Transcript_31493/g.62228 Transcript_31493/m.62228 type:complete len:203 (-) Transcript_31493:1026-1634(-)